MFDDEGIVAALKQMREEAEETERKCTDVADAPKGKKTAILERPRKRRARRPR